MAYSSLDLVKIVTPDDTLYYFKSVLRQRFALLETYFSTNPNGQEIILDLSTKGIRDLFVYCDHKISSTTIKDWINLLDVADYLKLCPLLTSFLLKDAITNFYTFHRIVTRCDLLYYDPKITTIQEALVEFKKLVAINRS